MKRACLILLIAGIVSLIQGCSGIAGPPNLQGNSKIRRVNETETWSTASHGTNSASAQLIGSSSNLTFGNVSVGSSDVLGVTLTNTGNSNVAISNVSVSGPGFNASGVSAGTILSPGQTETLSVSFAPSANASVSGSVTITSTATNPTFVIGLSGAGVQSTASSITISPANETVPVGSQVQFTATDSLGNNVTPSVSWSSSDPSVVSISANGLAIGVADGSATIKASK